MRRSSCFVTTTVIDPVDSGAHQEGDRERDSILGWAGHAGGHQVQDEVIELLPQGFAVDVADGHTPLIAYRRFRRNPLDAGN